ncbi:uncharacterized protein PAC_02522 [Phialocephala subalpina]|uniref:Uncharacterized protein n=1 Tax=Phialocephala subalpina TaxID=576137 RepID=A0A1L7WIQ2_9HELO|nr:uncharacterized protein PAC_02522 [Phialocephala subalpina]
MQEGDSFLVMERWAYGYLPSEAANTTFYVIFALAFLAHVMFGVLFSEYRIWGFSVALGFGTLLELIGYGGRVGMHGIPSSNWAYASLHLPRHVTDAQSFGINIVRLTGAPAFIAAGIYLTLEHFAIILGQKYSRIAPRWYTRIFTGCDVISIVIKTYSVFLALQTVSRIMQNEVGFIVLDGGSYIVACVALIIWHPADMILKSREIAAFEAREPTVLRNVIRVRASIGREAGRRAMGEEPMFMEQRVIEDGVEGGNVNVSGTEKRDQPVLIEDEVIVGGAESGNVKIGAGKCWWERKSRPANVYGGGDNVGGADQV